MTMLARILLRSVFLTLAFGSSACSIKWIDPTESLQPINRNTLVSFEPDRISIKSKFTLPAGLYATHAEGAIEYLFIQSDTVVTAHVLGRTPVGAPPRDYGRNSTFQFSPPVKLGQLIGTKTNTALIITNSKDPSSKSHFARSFESLLLSMLDPTSDAATHMLQSLNFPDFEQIEITGTKWTNNTSEGRSVKIGNPKIVISNLRRKLPHHSLARIPPNERMSINSNTSASYIAKTRLSMSSMEITERLDGDVNTIKVPGLDLQGAITLSGSGVNSSFQSTESRPCNISLGSKAEKLEVAAGGRIENIRIATTTSTTGSSALQLQGAIFGANECNITGEALNLSGSLIKTSAGRVKLDDPIAAIHWPKQWVFKDCEVAKKTPGRDLTIYLGRTTISTSGKNFSEVIDTTIPNSWELRKVISKSASYSCTLTFPENTLIDSHSPLQADIETGDFQLIGESAQIKDASLLIETAGATATFPSITARIAFEATPEGELNIVCKINSEVGEAFTTKEDQGLTFLFQEAQLDISNADFRFNSKKVTIVPTRTLIDRLISKNNPVKGIIPADLKALDLKDAGLVRNGHNDAGDYSIEIKDSRIPKKNKISVDLEGTGKFVYRCQTKHVKAKKKWGIPIGTETTFHDTFGNVSLRAKGTIPIELLPDQHAVLKNAKIVAKAPIGKDLQLEGDIDTPSKNLRFTFNTAIAFAKLAVAFKSWLDPFGDTVELKDHIPKSLFLNASYSTMAIVPNPDHFGLIEITEFSLTD